ncbi:MULTISPECIES: addiction module toxin RelE [unclassified Microcoleus]|uniref:type II toxin-antitoxin system RelE family toxin n=1 Tax=unclassified Microcoleus TaxID=2642155 RepID=UPI0025D66DB0|nr:MULTISPECIES: addiction module toxin RelE [unclassified Microcoleus]
MTPQQKFEIIFTRPVFQHLAAIDRKYYSLIRSTIEEQLSYEPEVETRNRKPLLEPSELGATWELRFGPSNRFRVFYETNLDTYEVYILGIGVKVGNQLFIGTEQTES